MRHDNAGTGDVRLEQTHDPRERLVREKYFSLRPRPLERWLWEQGVPAAAERVFWLHWQEGMKRGDWCSAVPIRRVAAECHLDVSTVTRAYQLLGKLGCLRRTDPGRDPANPFQQATAVTEVRVPRALLVELDRHPNRRTRAEGPEAQAPTVPVAESPTISPPAEPAQAPDPLAGLRGRERLRVLSRLKNAMSPAERRQYDEAFRTHATHIAFDPDTRLTAEERGTVLQLLSTLAAAPPASRPATPVASSGLPSRARRLSDFELARLRRDLQQVSSPALAAELLRQVAWSIEEGALRRFSAPHAIHIALKKIRDGLWTRPNRMPPNWSRGLGAAAAPEACRTA